MEFFLRDLRGCTVSSVSGVASSISEGDIFTYSCSAQLISFEIDIISKEINCAEHEYMNMSPPVVELATPLLQCSTLPPTMAFAKTQLAHPHQLHHTKNHLQQEIFQ